MGAMSSVSALVILLACFVSWHDAIAVNVARRHTASRHHSGRHLHHRSHDHGGTGSRQLGLHHFRKFEGDTLGPKATSGSGARAPRDARASAGDTFGAARVGKPGRGAQEVSFGSKSGGPGADSALGFDRPGAARRTDQTNAGGDVDGDAINAEADSGIADAADGAVVTLGPGGEGDGSDETDAADSPVGAAAGGSPGTSAGSVRTQQLRAKAAEAGAKAGAEAGRAAAIAHAKSQTTGSTSGSAASSTGSGAASASTSAAFSSKKLRRGGQSAEDSSKALLVSDKPPVVVDTDTDPNAKPNADVDASSALSKVDRKTGDSATSAGSLRIPAYKLRSPSGNAARDNMIKPPTLGSGGLGGETLVTDKPPVVVDTDTDPNANPDAMIKPPTLGSGGLGGETLVTDKPPVVVDTDTDPNANPNTGVAGSAEEPPIDDGTEDVTSEAPDDRNAGAGDSADNSPIDDATENVTSEAPDDAESATSESARSPKKMSKPRAKSSAALQPQDASSPADPLEARSTDDMVLNVLDTPDYFADLAASSGNGTARLVRAAVENMRQKIDQRLRAGPSLKLDVASLVNNFTQPHVVPSLPTKEVRQALAKAQKKLSSGLKGLEALPMANTLLNGTRQLQ